MIRANKAATAAATTAAARVEREGRSLVSDTSLAKPEPQTPAGAQYIEGEKRSEGRVERSVSGGRHHGTLVNIADAVGHSLASAEQEGTGGSHLGTAMGSLEKAYIHLGMHHSSHLMGNHEAAAGHLAKAGAHLTEAMSRVAGHLNRAGVVNAYGEKHSRADLAQTVSHTVSHYATHHGVAAAPVGEVQKPQIQEIKQPEGGVTKYSAAGKRIRTEETLIPSTTHTIPTANPKAKSSDAATRRIKEHGFGPIAKAPRVRSEPTPAPVDEEAAEYHLHGAILGLATRGSIPLHHIDGLSDNQIDEVHRFVESKSRADLMPHLARAQKIVTKYQKRMYK